MIEARVVDVGTFKDLSNNNGLDINRVKWSYYQGVMVDRRYLVKDEEI